MPDREMPRESNTPCPDCGRYTLTANQDECFFCGWTDGVISAWWWVAASALVAVLAAWWLLS